MSEVIICPYCNEEQEYQGGQCHSVVFFSEGNHKLECYQCGNVFRVNTETRYVYGVEGMEERSTKQKRGISGDLKIVEYVEGEELEE